MDEYFMQIIVRKKKLMACCATLLKAMQVLKLCQASNTADIGYSFLKHRACRFLYDDS